MPIINSSRDRIFTPLTWTFFITINLLIGAELVPISLIHNMASDLGRSVGEIGYTITAVGVVSFFTALFLKPLFPKANRRNIILAVGIILTISNLIVAYAHSYVLMLFGRALLGLCVGTFWSLSNSILQKEIDAKVLPKAMSFVFSGVSISSVISLPLCAFLVRYIDWRTIFEVMALLSLFATVLIYLTLPSIEAHQSLSIRSFNRDTNKRFYAMLFATLCCFGGYYFVFSYIQLFMAESSTALTELAQKISISALSLIYSGIAEFSLTIFAIFNVAGTVLAGVVYSKNFHKTFIRVPIIYCILFGALVLSCIYTPALLLIPLFFIGLCFGLVPISFSLWAMRHTPNHTEAVGCINVALIQLTIGFSSMIGGLVVDNTASSTGLIWLSILSFVAYAIGYVACSKASPHHIESDIDLKLYGTNKNVA